MSPATEAELLASLSRSVERNENMAAQLTKIDTAQQVKEAVDKERHQTLLNMISNVTALVLEKTNALGERVKKLEDSEKESMAEAKKEAKEEVRYWARWALATIVTIGFAILLAVVKVKHGLPKEIRECRS